MRRRDFIRLVVGCGTGWPLSASPQQSRGWRLGFLHPGQSTLVGNRVVAFREGLGGAALREAANAEILGRLPNGQVHKLPGMGLELVEQNFQAICAVSPPAVIAATKASGSIPIVA